MAGVHRIHTATRLFEVPGYASAREYALHTEVAEVTRPCTTTRPCETKEST